MKMDSMKIFNYFFVSKCPCCGAMQQNYDFCEICYKKFDLIPFVCMKCQDFFETSVPFESVCLNCQESDKNYLNCIFSFFSYNQIIKNLILRFKNNSDFLLGKVFAKLLYYKGLNLNGVNLMKADYICPVPLEKYRLIERGYNQSYILGRNISKFSKVPCYNILNKIKYTPSQGKKTYEERILNVKDAFEVNFAFANNLKGKTILLVDDVITTGATVLECSKTLSEAGAIVNVVSIARRTIRKKRKKESLEKSEIY